MLSAEVSYRFCPHCGGTLERLRATEELRLSEARLSEIYANMDDAVYVLGVTANDDFTYEIFNPRCEQVTGLKSAEVCGRPLAEVLPPLVERNQLAAYQHGGFWQCMDTYREQQLLTGMWNSGKAQPFVNVFDNGTFLLNISVNNIPLTQLNGITRRSTPVFLSAGLNVISAADPATTDYFVRDGGSGTCTL